MELVLIAYLVATASAGLAVYISAQNKRRFACWLLASADADEARAHAFTKAHAAYREQFLPAEPAPEREAKVLSMGQR